MTDTRFDLCFDGTLAADADPSRVRQHLGAAFKLDDQGVARLFTGKQVYIRRDVDIATAARFDRVFKQAGAVLQILPIAAAETPAEPIAEQGNDEDRSSLTMQTTTASTVGSDSGLSLATQDGFLETPPTVKMPVPDTSHLSLVSGPDWTLEDCEPIVATTPVADISHLTLVDLDPVPDTQRSTE